MNAPRALGVLARAEADQCSPMAQGRDGPCREGTDPVLVLDVPCSSVLRPWQAYRSHQSHPGSQQPSHPLAVVARHTQSMTIR